MAIATSLEWQLGCTNTNRRTHHLPVFSDKSRSLPFLSILCFHPRILIARSSSSSPVLDAASPSTNSLDIPLESKPKNLDSSSLLETDDSNGLICTLFEHPQTYETAYNTYMKAKENPGFKPKKLVLKLVINYLIRLRKWDSLFSMCDDFIGLQVFPDGPTCFRLISRCIGARKFRLVNRLLEIFSGDRSVACLAYNAAMKGYNKLHMYSSTISVFQRMNSADIALDSGCYYHIMDAYLKKERYDDVVAVFEEFRSKNTGSSSPFLSRIYWNFCEALGKSGRPSEALEFFREITKKDEGFENHLFYSSLINSFLNIRELGKAEELLTEAESKKMLRDPALFLKLVLLYLDQGMIEKTLDVVALMDRVKIRVSDCILCAIVNGYAKKRGLRAAVKAYEDLILQGCEPGQVTYASIINIYCRLGLYDQAELTFSEMQEKRFTRCVVAYSNMIAMYAKTGRQNDALKLLEKMKEKGCKPNVWVYNTLLDMHGKAMNLNQLEITWKEMNRRKIRPDKVSYTSLIGAYSRARELEKCIKIYNEFRVKGGMIDRAMAGIMVGVFSKMNKVDELVKLLQDMKAQGTELDGRLYRTAMNALRDDGMLHHVKWLQETFESQKWS